MDINLDSKKEPEGFLALGLPAPILQILRQRKIETPTPIQHQSIPHALKGQDIVGIAQTGTGKTFAFGLPLLAHLASGKKRALIVLPTRELAYQVEESLKPYADTFNIKMAVFVGGAPMRQQLQMIKRNPRILIATPGRLNDHLEQRTVTLKEVEVLVLDEADRMLDMGFKPQIDRILKHVPKERQTLLFSATMPEDIMKLAREEMKMPLHIEIARAGTAAETVEQELIVVRSADKQMLLEAILHEEKGQVLVFTRTKHGAKKLNASLGKTGVKAAEIHANRSLAQRRQALEGFRAGRYKVLIATDIASRGIDVSGITLVVNYDLPDDAAEYVHRIGRTGRAKREGKAVSFATPEQVSHVRDIEKLIKTTLPRATHAAVPPMTLDTKPSSRPSRRPPRRGGRGRRPMRKGR